VDSQTSNIQRLSWQSIEAFGHAQSGMEHIVKTMKNREDRKSKVYSIMISTAVIMAFCYIVAGLIVSDQDGGGSATSTDYTGREDGEGQGPPKFLMPITMLLP
jgi:hypothetical protein